MIKVFIVRIFLVITYCILVIMSTSRGSSNRTRPQKHQNRTAFKNDLHDTSKKTKSINSLDITGVCKRCKEIIDWKIKYKKYKPLTAPSKCVTCSQKTVKFAYHVLCKNCSMEKKTCAKCCKSVDSEEKREEDINIDIKDKLKSLSERKRRTILRFLKKQQDANQTLSPEMVANIEDIMSKIGKISLDDDDFNGFSDEDFNDLESDDGSDV